MGLVTGACFAEMGNQITCLDIDEEKLQLLKKGKVPFYEPGLEEIVSRNLLAGRLCFDKHYEVLKEASICFLALPTPSSSDGSCDLSYLFNAIEQVAQNMQDALTIVIKSTVPVGTAECLREKIQNFLALQGTDYSFEILSNPEFLREGSAIADCLKPDRIVIGAENPLEDSPGIEMMKKLYAPFHMSRDRLFIMDLRSAELSKYAANAMLATRISFMNELAGLCEKIGAQINHVRLALGSDHRIGTHYLYPGLGYGGSCLPKDLRALKAMAQSSTHATPLLDSVESINNGQILLFIEKIATYFGSLRGKTLAIWGLAFKPNTDDLRDAPSLYLIERLHELGAFLKVYDPVAMNKARKILSLYDRLLFCENEYIAAENADAILLITEWKQFRLVDFSKILSSMEGRAFFDGRNQYTPSTMQESGFDYICIGHSSPMIALNSR